MHESERNLGYAVLIYRDTLLFRGVLQSIFLLGVETNESYKAIRDFLYLLYYANRKFNPVG